jgi:hypothetical protein
VGRQQKNTGFFARLKRRHVHSYNFSGVEKQFFGHCLFSLVTQLSGEQMIWQLIHIRQKVENRLDKDDITRGKTIEQG